MCVRVDAQWVTNAASLNEVDVTNAINNAPAGSTINLPVGTNTWTVTCVITNNVMVIGSGNTTKIVDAIPNANWAGLISWNTLSNYNQCEISNMWIEGGSQSSSDSDAQGEITFNNGFCPVCHVSHVYFHNLLNCAVEFLNGNYGCLDHCTATTTNFTDTLVEGFNGGLGGIPTADTGNAYGDESWATAVQWGGTNEWIYAEYNYVSNSTYIGANDALDGTRMVYRYNTNYNTYFQTHGTETGTRYRSGRAFEVYSNVWTMTNPTYTNSNTFAGARGGSGVIFGNTVIGYGSSCMNLVCYRTAEAFGSFYAANGYNPWDTNGAIVASGTFNGTTGQHYLTDTTSNWTANQYVGGINGLTNLGYEVVDVTQGGTNYNFQYSVGEPQVVFGSIVSNDTHDVYATGDRFGDCISWTNGDKYQIIVIYATIDQPGRGQGDLITDNGTIGNPINSVTGRTNWPNETLEPWYDWSNTNNGALTGFGTNVPTAGCGDQVAATIIPNRDYYDYTVKPGYVPLGQHPLDIIATNPVVAQASGGMPPVFFGQ